MRAAGAATAELAEGAEVLELALTSPADIAAALGGLTPQGIHAAELAADALHRALTALAGSGERLAAPAAGERVMVALSGGVDSAVAALLERRRGAEVIGVTVKLWTDERTDGAKACCSPQAVLGARGLAHSLGIPHLTLDLEDRFRERVVGGFVDGYREGRTPNPCVLCNGEVRLDAMIALADRCGSRTLVTGHYARVVSDRDGPLLAGAADPAKDQSYMLARLRPSSLERLRFPLADLTKPEVRAIAAEAGLPVASKAESQDLCFLAGEGKRSFLARHGSLRDRSGALVDSGGRVVGAHRGHHHFTVGQRRGIGVAATEPLYVLATEAASNRVVVGSRDELATTRVRLRDARLHRDPARAETVRLRYRSAAIECEVEGIAELSAGDHDELWLRLAEPAYGVAPGQTAVLHGGGAIIGHGTIA
jgi:tRNA-specific 2-thiouridylase